MPRKFPVVLDSWSEYEAGWGRRPAGFTAHLTAADHEAFVHEYNLRYNSTGGVPAVYLQADRQPQVVDVPAKVYRRLKKSKNGIFLDGLE